MPWTPWSSEELSVAFIFLDSLVAANNAMDLLVLEQEVKDKQHQEDYHIAKATTNINSLRATMLRIIKNHLTALVGQCTLAGRVKKKEYRILCSSEEVQNLEIVQKQQEIELIQEAQTTKKQGGFELLSVLQHRQHDLITQINVDLKKIGVQIENICIYTVQPTKQIQIELDK